METEGVIWLRAIQDGSILKYLTEFSELEKWKLPGLRRKFMNTVVRANKNDRFPKRKVLKSLMGCPDATLYSCANYLKTNLLLIDVTIPELLNLFEIRKGSTLYLPSQLDKATYYDISTMRVGSHRGDVSSWDKKKQNSRNAFYQRYYISLISENGLPAWVYVFRFLKQYEDLIKL